MRFTVHLIQSTKFFFWGLSRCLFPPPKTILISTFPQQQTLESVRGNHRHGVKYCFSADGRWCLLRSSFHVIMLFNSTEAPDKVPSGWIQSHTALHFSHNML
uniref:Uncharacterized protein n=1 Tax=Anguilla anguilla TaxID=7936 RepID=A0A0E9X3K9_ANGAN